MAEAPGFELRIENRREMRRFGARLASLLRPGDALFLEGALGAGKTFLTRAVARALGVPSREPVTSPTFALVQTIESGRVPLLHADLYRLNDPGELEELGLSELVERSVAILEWSLRFADDIAEDGLVIEIQGRDRGRTLKIHARGRRGEEMLVALSR